ncbi:MAG TPA: hypothetical protein VKF39_02525, partial [Nitrososphaerales archaeon]|nr:hypothetical protein [Nitrososphaerales archaeon]
ESTWVWRHRKVVAPLALVAFVGSGMLLSYGYVTGYPAYVVMGADALAFCTVVWLGFLYTQKWPTVRETSTAVQGTDP